MPLPTDMPPNLTVLLSHVRAVRAVTEYLYEGGFTKDIRVVHEKLREAIEAGHPTLKAWHYEAPKRNDIFAGWTPKSKWKIGRKESIGLYLALPNPIGDTGDENPYVYWYAPQAWRKKRRLDERLLDLKKQGGAFEHYQDLDMDPESPVWIWVEYAERQGSFDWPKLTRRVVRAVGLLLALEKEIDTIVAAK